MGLSPSPAQMPLQGLCSCAPSSRKDLEATSEETAHTVFAQTEYDWPGMGWGSREGRGVGRGGWLWGLPVLLRIKYTTLPNPPDSFIVCLNPFLPACLFRIYFFFSNTHICAQCGRLKIPQCEKRTCSPAAQISARRHFGPFSPGVFTVPADLVGMLELVPHVLSGWRVFP